MKKKKCLIISSRYPYSYIGGDSIRTKNMINYMQSLNYDVDLLCFTEKKRTNIRNPQKLNKIFILENINRPYKFLSIILNLFKLIPLQCSYYINFNTIPKLKNFKFEKYETIIIFLTRLAPISNYINTKSKIILDLADILTLNYSNAWKANGLDIKWKLIYTLEWPLIRRYEKQLLKTNFNKLFVSNRDIDFANKKLKGKKSTIFKLSNHIDEFSLEEIKKISRDKILRRDKSKPYKVCFIGNMQAQHNQSSVKELTDLEFIEKLKSINCELYIVGRISDKQKKFYTCKGLKVIQNPKNILKACRDFNCGISVLNHCSGLQNKLYDYTLLGIPIISSFDSAEGIGFKKDKHYLMANNKDQIINSLKKLINDELFGYRLNSNCLSFVNNNYSKTKILNDLNAIINNS